MLFLPLSRGYPTNPSLELGRPHTLISLPSSPREEKQTKLLQESLLSVGEAFPVLASVSERLQLQTFVQATVMYDLSIVAHQQRVVSLVAATAHLLDLPPEEVAIFCLAAFLHDLGKICLPYSVVQKAGPLNEQEWHLMRQHPTLGAALLTFAGGVFAALAPIVIAHHERMDGSGYPCGLAGEDIPLGARLISVIDSYDAMTTLRPYSVPQLHEQACTELVRCAGTRYDPQVVAAFLLCSANCKLVAA